MHVAIELKIKKLERGRGLLAAAGGRAVVELGDRAVLAPR
jgi:hypothetical protein